ncbi:hypothetical protein Aperf_G00000001112 [Anoplocephala perfoliata]
MIWQRIKEELDSEAEIFEFVQSVTTILEKWSVNCLPMEPSYRLYFIRGFFSLSELILDAVIIKSDGVAINGERVYQLLRSFTNIFKSLASTNSTELLLECHSFVCHFNSPQGKIGYLRARSPDHTDFSVLKMQDKLSLEITLFNVMPHHAFLHIKKLRPVSALVYVGEADSSHKKNIAEGRLLQFTFKNLRLTTAEDVECLSVKMTKKGLLDYNEVDCTTERITENEVNCKCSSAGFIFVTLLTETSNNLKTAVSRNFRLNVPLLLILVFHRIIAIFGIVFLLLVALCLPTDPLKLIIIPKAVAVTLSLFVCSYYLRMESYRYVDEFLAGIIYFLGDIVDIILGLVFLVGSKGSGRLQHLLFAFAFVFNRAIVNLMAAIYIVFFKISMMKFYYRLHQVMIRRRSLRLVLEDEQQIKLFRLVKTFTELNPIKFVVRVVIQIESHLVLE